LWTIGLRPGCPPCDPVHRCGVGSPVIASHAFDSSAGSYSGLSGGIAPLGPIEMSDEHA
jgi:hypothetical protein